MIYRVKILSSQVANKDFAQALGLSVMLASYLAAQTSATTSNKLTNRMEAYCLAGF